MTLVINYAGKAGCSNVTQTECLGGSQKSSKNKVISLQGKNNSLPESCVDDKGGSSSCSDKYLWFGPRGNGGMCLYCRASFSIWFTFIYHVLIVDFVIQVIGSCFALVGL